MAEKLDRFTKHARQVLQIAQEEAVRLNHNYVGTEHLLLGLVKEENGLASKVLREVGATAPEVVRLVELVAPRNSRAPFGRPTLTPRTKRVLEVAVDEAKQMGHVNIGTEHLLLGLVHEDEGIAAEVLRQLGASPEKIRSETTKAVFESQVQEKATKKKESKTPLTDQLGFDLTARAEAGKLDPVIGRDKEIERVIQILSRRTKNNPALIGEPGVGKTAIVEGLAQRIINGDVPETLIDKRVLMLDVGALVAGTMYRGQFEERLKKVIEEITNSDAILFIDEVHMLVGAGGAGGSMDAANLLKPALARGELQCIGATTLDEYRKYIEGDAALERRFQPVLVEEPTIEETVDILKGVRKAYEAHHQIAISDEALGAAARLSARYVPDRFLPDKAIDLMDEAASRVRMYKVPQALTLRETFRELKSTQRQKAEAVESKQYDAAVDLRHHEMELEHKTRTVAAGLAAACPAADRDRGGHCRGRGHVDRYPAPPAGGQGNRPAAGDGGLSPQARGEPGRAGQGHRQGGPPRPHRSERPQAAHRHVHVPRPHRRRQDAAGQEPGRVSVRFGRCADQARHERVHGAPQRQPAGGRAPGYVGYDEGGQLSEAVRRRPYCVILLDEIEKAHPEVFNMLLQIMEDGSLSDAKGRRIDFRNAILIMTSNVGANLIKHGATLGFAVSRDEDKLREDEYSTMRDRVTEALKRTFRPEFLNRLDGVMVFRNLTKEQITEIVDLELNRVRVQLKEQEITLEATDEVKGYLADAGYDPDYGARPLRRVIQDKLEDRLSEGLLGGWIKPGDTVRVELDSEGQIQLVTIPALPEGEPLLAEALA